METKGKRFYTTTEVSRICGVHFNTVKKWVDAGELPARRTPGGLRRISPADLARFLLKHNYRLPSELKESVEEGAPGQQDGADVSVPLAGAELWEHLPVGVVQLDAEGKIVYENRNLLRVLTGWESEEPTAVGRPIAELPPLAALGVDEPLQRLVNEGVPIRHLFIRYKTQSDVSVNVSLSGAPLRDVRSRQVGSLLFVEDVGQALELEREASRAQEFMRTVVETAGVAIFGFDTSGGITIFNRKAQEITGYTEEEARQPDFLAKILPDRQALVKVEWAIAQHFQGKAAEETVLKIVIKSGGERILSVSTSMVYADSGRVAAVIAGATDITERELLQRRIQESNDFLHSVIDNSPFSLQIVDQNGWTVKVNRALTRTFDVTESDLVGVGVHNFFEDHRLVATGIAAALKKALDGEITTVPFAEFETDDYTQPGESGIAVSAVAFPIVRSGEARCAGIIYEDITEKAALQRDLISKNAELEAFVYTVAHDLKSPLGVISACGEALTSLLHGGEAENQVKMIVRNAGRMREFINGLLTLSRAGRWDAEQRYDSPASAVVKSVFHDLRTRCPGEEMRLHVGDLPTINLHPDAATQLFQNLIGNAHKYRHPDRTLDVEVECETTAGAFRFSVKDNGIGISAQDRGRIFDVFFRGDNTEQPGTGVGLAIVRRIVERGGGRVWVHSKPDVGSTFYFTLPRSQQDQSSAT
jgi:PAS domain S-box-containing protein/excisionase family DNA binding protein